PNVQGIGARVRLTRPGGVDERTVGGARSYLSQTELTLTYGLGTGSGPVGLEVIWPDGVSQKIDGIQVDREIVVSRL
ncbi:MAG: ASPIC/UnbV domain-containing protein, partial [Gammaproteobacteria bacterium]